LAIIEADYWIAPLLRFYDKFKTNKLITFVKALDDKFAHDWLVGRTPTTRIENVNAIIQAVDNAETSDNLLQNSCLQLNRDDLLNAFGGNIYGRRAAKYILLKLPF
jgi:hypothetical protein